MSDDVKLALFVGGNADGFTQEIDKIEPLLNWYGNSYALRGRLETRTLGTVQLYVFEGMPREEELLRTDIIKKTI